MSGPDRSLQNLHPCIREQALAFSQHAVIQSLDLRIFEGYRSPQRQHHLFNMKNAPTKAAAWQSAHQYGLAFDVARYFNRAWSWDIDQNDIEAAQEVAIAMDLRCPIDWDPLHFQHAAFPRVYDTLF